jgi:uncharacterized membrane protein
MLVPSYMPFNVFWAGFTGTAMILAGISFLIRVKVELAALLLSIMLGLFVLMIHVPQVMLKTAVQIDWVRTLQDIAIMGAALMLTAPVVLRKAGRFVYAIPVLILGLFHFIHAAFITAKIPAYFPAINICDYIVGGIIVIATLCIITGMYTMKALRVLNITLLAMALCYSVPILFKHPFDAISWTTLLLDLAVAAGGFIMSGRAAEVGI